MLQISSNYPKLGNCKNSYRASRYDELQSHELWLTFFHYIMSHVDVLCNQPQHRTLNSKAFIIQ